MDDLHAAICRVFRCYLAFCEQSRTDTLFDLLNSIHSLHDRLVKGLNRNLYDSDEFLAVKCLRNYFHHQGEIKHDMRILIGKDIPSVHTDLWCLCLVPVSVVVAAVENVDKKYRQQAGCAGYNVFKQYGDLININPAIFNLVVKIFLLIEDQTSSLKNCKAFQTFKAQIEIERERGMSHFISGDIYCHAGNIDAVLENAMKLAEPDE